MSALTVDHVEQSLQTVAVGTTAIITYAIPDASVFRFKVIVLAQTGTGLMQSFKQEGAVKRWAGGAATFVTGSPETAVTGTDASFGASQIPTITVSGNNLVISAVQSQAGTYNWHASLYIEQGYTP